MTISIEAARQVLQSQPFSRLLNAELALFSAEGVELRLPASEQVKQQNGFVHGGVVSYAADNALTFAGGFVLGSAVVTSEFKINYVRPVVGHALIARANVIHAGKTQAVCRCEIFSLTDNGEILCAIAQGTIAVIHGLNGA